MQEFIELHCSSVKNCPLQETANSPTGGRPHIFLCHISYIYIIFLPLLMGNLFIALIIQALAIFSYAKPSKASLQLVFFNSALNFSWSLALIKFGFKKCV